MSNPFFNSSDVNNATNNSSNINNQALVNAAQQAKAIMQNMNSPQMQFVMRFLSGKNITAQQAVEMLCAQNGINANEFMEQIRSSIQ